MFESDHNRAEAFKINPNSMCFVKSYGLRHAMACNRSEFCVCFTHLKIYPFIVYIHSTVVLSLSPRPIHSKCCGPTEWKNNHKITYAYESHMSYPFAVRVFQVNRIYWRTRTHTHTWQVQIFKISDCLQSAVPKQIVGKSPQIVRLLTHTQDEWKFLFVACVCVSMSTDGIYFWPLIA